MGVSSFHVHWALQYKTIHGIGSMNIVQLSYIIHVQRCNMNIVIRGNLVYRS